MSLLTATKLSVIRSGHCLLRDAGLHLAAGELHVLLGPNGAGKSTLLRVLAGEWRATTGQVLLAGRPLEQWTPLAQARCRAVLPQHDPLSFGFTVKEVIQLGRLAAATRHPGHEKTLLDEVMAATELGALAERRYPSLSGGERRRVQLARVLAQVWDAQQPVLLLDEPVHSLDPAHQHRVMALLRRLAKRGFGIVASLHELNLAAAYADHISLLRGGCILSSGATDQVLDNASLRETYGHDLQFTAVLHEGRSHWLSHTRPAESAAHR